MKRALPFLLVALVLSAIGCQSEAPIADAQNKNAEGEVEGKAPAFVSVPAQNDPSNPNRQ
jgi:hypothetical protein